MPRIWLLDPQALVYFHGLEEFVNNLVRPATTFREVFEIVNRNFEGRLAEAIVQEMTIASTKSLLNDESPDVVLLETKYAIYAYLDRELLDVSSVINRESLIISAENVRQAIVNDRELVDLFEKVEAALQSSHLDPDPGSRTSTPAAHLAPIAAFVAQ